MAEREIGLGLVLGRTPLRPQALRAIYPFTVTERMEWVLGVGCWSPKRRTTSSREGDEVRKTGRQGAFVSLSPAPAVIAVIGLVVR